MKRYIRLIASFFALFSLSSAHAAFIDIKPIQICNDSGSSCAVTGFFEDITDKIWAQAGIDINFLSTSTVNNSAWMNIDIDSNPSNSRMDDEAVDIINFAESNINDSNATLAINMFFVDSLDNSGGFFGLGCGAPVYAVFCRNETGIFISDNIFAVNRIDTIAHEIGHVLGLTHGGFGAGVASNLMTAGGSRSIPTGLGDISPDGLGLSNLTSTQIRIANDSRFVQLVSEPGSLSVFLLALLLPILRNRKAGLLKG